MKRAPALATLRRFDVTYSVGILDPMPRSLSPQELKQTLMKWRGGPLDIKDWLSDQLYETTGRRYLVKSDPTTWEHAQGGTRITYEGVRITEAPSAEGQSDTS